MVSFFPKYFGLFWILFSSLGAFSLLALIAAEYHKQKQIEKLREKYERLEKLRELKKEKAEGKQPSEFETDMKTPTLGEDLSRDQALSAIKDMMDQ